MSGSILKNPKIMIADEFPDGDDFIVSFIDAIVYI